MTHEILRTAFAVFTCAFSATLTQPVQAIIVTLDSFVDNSSISGTGQAASRQASTNHTVLHAGGVAADVVGTGENVELRYTSTAVADNGSGSPADSVTVTHDYTATVKISAASGVIYSLLIESRLRGALTLVDEAGGFGGANGNASVSNMAASVNGVSNPDLTLAIAFSQDSDTINGHSAIENVPVENFGNLPLSNLQGTNTFALHFVWTTTATSGFSSAGQNGDEAAARFGDLGTLLDVLADDYPGIGSRDINSDGHLLYVNATIQSVPEPSTWALASLAAVGLFLARRKHRHAR